MLPLVLSLPALCHAWVTAAPLHPGGGMQASGVEDEAEAEGLLPELSERACSCQMRKPEKLLREKGRPCVFCEKKINK